MRHDDEGTRTADHVVVEVQVEVDVNGRVTSAQAISGPDILRAAALEAAKTAKFVPYKLNGTLVKVSGPLKFNFALER